MKTLPISQPMVEIIDPPQGFELTPELLASCVGHKDPPGKPGEPGVREVADDG